VTRPREQWTARAIVTVVVALGATVLAPEISIGRVDLNDSVFHFGVIDRLAQRVRDGQPVLDFWMPEWSFGYPVVRTYQPLGHWLVVAVHFAAAQQFPLDALFSFLRYLLLVSYPLTVYAGCRAASMRPLTAAAVAMLSPLIASPNLFGIEYGSYVWRGNGLYTQLVAAHFFALAIGLGCAAIRRGRAVTAAGLLLALTFLSHFIYGYMAAATLILVACIPDPETPARRRFIRLLWTGALSFGLAAFHIIPMMSDGPFINRSRWEPLWKWESFGFAQVFGTVASGNLLDAGRLPILSLLALYGAVSIVRRRHMESPFIGALALGGSALWLFLFCGRAAWGPLFKAIGLSEAAQLHRFIGGAQWFLVILAAIGLTRVWIIRPWFWGVASTVALLWFPASERLQFLREGQQWGRQNLAAHENHRMAIEDSTAAVQRAGGRVYPGLAAQWGAQFRIGYVPYYAFLSRAHVPSIGFLYHSMALTSDVMVRFDQNRPDHYRLFDIRTAVAESTRAMPPFLNAIGSTGGFTVYRAPDSRAFELVNVPRSVYVDGRTFYGVNDAWLQSGWAASRTHLLLDYVSAVPMIDRTRLPDLAALTTAPQSVACGNVVTESVHGDVHRTTLDVTADRCFVLFKMTYHPNWRATVDGAAKPVMMLTPGFMGIPVPPGRHSVELQYAPGNTKLFLLALVLPILFGSFAAERKGFLQSLEERSLAIGPSWDESRTYAVLVLILVLPVAVPFISATQPNGHDVAQYLPRVTEFHENIRHGNLLPRWAPDLSSGQGQPLFLLNPPFFYYLTEAFYLVGFSFAGAMNAACVLLILLSAATMYILGRWYFGPAGGAIAAVAYVYAPYFLVDLYVRNAFAEFAVFPFYPLVLYGFARHAESRDRRWLLVATFAYAAIWFAHTPAALLFSPLMGSFVLFLAWRGRDVRLLASQAAAAALGMLMAAAVWLPSVVESPSTHLHRLTEGPLRYAAHFVAPRQFFSRAWGYGISGPGLEDGMPFSLGWPHLLIAGIAVVAVARSGAEHWKQWAAFFSVAAFVQCFLMTQRAHALWDAVPQLHYVAFPWRLLAPTAFCLALLAGLIALALRDLTANWRTTASIAVLAALVLPALRHAQPASYLTVDPAQGTPQQIAARGVVAGTFDTFEPRWIETRPVYDGGRVHVNRGRATVQVLRREPTRLLMTVAAATPSELELPISFFPGWQLRVDGAAVEPDVPSSSGRIRLTVGPGTQRVEATFRRTPVRWIADASSVLALLLAAIAWFTLRSRSSSPADPPSAAAPRGPSRARAGSSRG
jgi:uncharacterized membrane protein